jgi:competence ComEA-like helix-hairpin-helix protein
MSDRASYVGDDQNQLHSVADTLPVEIEVPDVAPIPGVSSEPILTRFGADNLQIQCSPASERDRFLFLLGWLFFGVMSTQYLIMVFDRPDPLPWQRGPAFQLYRVDVNTGTWVEWMQLDGVGQTMAHRIVANRDEFGPFPTIDDLIRVDGIGPVTLDRLRPWLTISHEDDEQRIRGNDGVEEYKGPNKQSHAVR